MHMQGEGEGGNRDYIYIYIYIYKTIVKINTIKNMNI